jgi:MYXO-CTERM domain-containing protein
MKPILLTLALLAVLVAPTHADEGHSHDAPAAATGPALPRFTAVSEAFELVGVVNGKLLTIYLDRFDDNSPVPDAKLELEVGGKKVPVSVHAPGEYEATLPEELKPGLTPVTVALQVKGESDLLAGEIDIHEDEHADAEGAGWTKYAAWGGAALLVLGAATFMARRRASRRTLGGAA